MHKVKIRLTRMRLETLAGLYKRSDMYPAASDWEQLLLEHFYNITAVLHRMLQLTQERYTLQLTAPEALAFIQYWHIVALPTDPFARALLLEIIAAIDRASKNAAHGFN